MEYGNLIINRSADESIIMCENNNKIVEINVIEIKHYMVRLSFCCEDWRLPVWMRVNDVFSPLQNVHVKLKKIMVRSCGLKGVCYSCRLQITAPTNMFIHRTENVTDCGESK